MKHMFFAMAAFGLRRALVAGFFLAACLLLVLSWYELSPETRDYLTTSFGEVVDLATRAITRAIEWIVNEARR